MHISIEVHNILNFGNALHDLGRKEDALVDYSKAIEINPRFVDSYVYKGEYHFNNL